MRNYFFLKKYVTSEGAVSHNVLYYEPLPVTKYVFMQTFILSKQIYLPAPLYQQSTPSWHPDFFCCNLFKTRQNEYCLSHSVTLQHWTLQHCFHILKISKLEESSRESERARSVSFLRDFSFPIPISNIWCPTSLLVIFLCANLKSILSYSLQINLAEYIAISCQ